MFDPYSPVMGRPEAAPEWTEIADEWQFRFTELVSAGGTRLGQAVYNACPIPTTVETFADCFYNNNNVEDFVLYVYNLWRERR